MRLATLRVPEPRSLSEAKDGALLVVSSDGARAARVPSATAPNLRSALEDWDRVEPELGAIVRRLEAGSWPETVDLASARLMAPLPRAWAWLDGSAYLQHVLLVRKARGAEPPEDLRTIPLLYQGCSDNLLGPNDDIPLRDASDGLDFEGEVAVILGETPMGLSAREAGARVRLVMLMNDVSLRALIPRELKTGFGFYHGKPPSSFSPFAVTPDELGPAWREGRLHLDLETRWNGELFGRPDAGEMHFSFHQLIEHAARTRPLSAGTILGGGTVSNADESRGSSCIVERRMIETIRSGKPSTGFMQPGDTVEMLMRRDGRNLFGAIRQRVVKVQ